MNLMDIISLTKAGYKKKDIDELLKVEVDEPKPDDQKSTEPETGPEGGPEQSPEDDHAASGDPETGAEPEPDYKSQYENLKKEMDELKKQLKEAQLANVRKNSEPEQTDRDKEVADIFRSFM